MGKTVQFKSDQQAHHLQLALELTGSDGFMADAKAIAAYVPARGGGEPVLQAIGVFECFRGGRAELHVGCAPGHRMTAEVIATLSMIAFNPRFFGLETLLARVPMQNVGAICTLLKIGFEIQHRDRASVAGAGDAIVLSLSSETVLASAGPRDEDYRPEMGAVAQE